MVSGQIHVLRIGLGHLSVVEQELTKDSGCAHSLRQPGQVGGGSKAMRSTSVTNDGFRRRRRSIGSIGGYRAERNDPDVLCRLFVGERGGRNQELPPWQLTRMGLGSLLFGPGEDQSDAAVRAGWAEGMHHAVRGGRPHIWLKARRIQCLAPATTAAGGYSLNS